MLPLQFLAIRLMTPVSDHFQHMSHLNMSHLNKLNCSDATTSIYYKYVLIDWAESREFAAQLHV